MRGEKNIGVGAKNSQNVTLGPFKSLNDSGTELQNSAPKIVGK